MKLEKFVRVLASTFSTLALLTAHPAYAVYIPDENYNIQVQTAFIDQGLFQIRIGNNGKPDSVSGCGGVNLGGGYGLTSGHCFFSVTGENLKTSTSPLRIPTGSSAVVTSNLTGASSANFKTYPEPQYHKDLYDIQFGEYDWPFFGSRFEESDGIQKGRISALMYNETFDIAVFKLRTSDSNAFPTSIGVIDPQSIGAISGQLSDQAILRLNPETNELEATSWSYVDLIKTGYMGPGVGSEWIGRNKSIIATARVSLDQLNNSNTLILERPTVVKNTVFLNDIEIQEVFLTPADSGSPLIAQVGGSYKVIGIFRGASRDLTSLGWVSLLNQNANDWINDSIASLSQLPPLGTILNPATFETVLFAELGGSITSESIASDKLFFNEDPNNVVFFLAPAADTYTLKSLAGARIEGIFLPATNSDLSLMGKSSARRVAAALSEISGYEGFVFHETESLEEIDIQNKYRKEFLFGVKFFYPEDIEETSYELRLVAVSAVPEANVISMLVFGGLIVLLFRKRINDRWARQYSQGNTDLAPSP